MITSSEIEKILNDSIGLNTASIGPSAVMNAVKQRMLVCKITDVSDYTKKINSDKNELQELVEEVVVSETWFFRDTQPFKMLTRFIKEEWLPSHPNKPVRILSLPCATGEEPYSIAITLIEAGLMPSQLIIDAFDISERNVKRCLSAFYSENSFRGVDPYIRDRFFNFDNGNYYPDILIKAMVNFEKASVLDPIFINTQIPYDIVFCRNLLIYFDRDTQAVASKMLYKLLKSEGMLFVGHAESSIFSGDWYISQRYPKSFIVRKFIDKAKNKAKINDIKLQYDNKYKLKNKLKTASNNTSKINIKRKSSSATRVKEGIIKPARPSIRTVNTTSSDNGLSIARKLADSGKLVEAEKICLQCLEMNKQDQEIYYLLAIIQLALGDERKSALYFKNVIYLDPNHYDALMYLSTLLGDEGDQIGATRFRERAARIKSKLISAR